MLDHLFAEEQPRREPPASAARALDRVHVRDGELLEPPALHDPAPVGLVERLSGVFDRDHVPPAADELVVLDVQGR